MIADLDLNPFSLLTKGLTFLLEKMSQGFGSVPGLVDIGTFGLAVIALTLILRTFLFPLFAWQLRTTRRSATEMTKIAPLLHEVRKKYKGQPQKMQAEMQKVYREHGISQFSSMQGCFPMVIQAMIIFPLYSSIKGASGALTSGLHFLWIPNIQQTAHDACCLVSKVGNVEQYSGWVNATGVDGRVFGMLTVQHWPLLLLPAFCGLATYIQSRMMLMPAAADASAQQQSMQNMGKTMTKIIPVFVFATGVTFPQGIALYWLTQSVYMIIQQYYLVGWGDLPVPHWVPGARRVTDLTHDSHRVSRQKVVVVPEPIDPARRDISITGQNGTPAAAAALAPDQPRMREIGRPPGGSPSRSRASGPKKRR